MFTQQDVLFAEEMSIGKRLTGKVALTIDLEHLDAGLSKCLGVTPIVIDQPVYPDIVVHCRGTRDFNKVAVEVKMADSMGYAEVAPDLVKLLGYCTFLRYTYGVFMCLEHGERKSIFASVMLFTAVEDSKIILTPFLVSLDGKVVTEKRVKKIEAHMTRLITDLQARAAKHGRTSLLWAQP